MEKQVPTPWHLPNKIIYIAFLVAAIIFVCSKDLSSAMCFGGIGFAFDPFDQSQAFNKRPMWQRVWLMVHVTGVLAILILLLMDWF